jgi:hypothetical protein
MSTLETLLVWEWGAACMYQGGRTTAASYLKDAPSNLTIAVNSPVAKVILDGKKAKGVKTIEGKEYFAKRTSFSREER